MAEQSGRGSLRLRLAVAFVAVALTAVVALALVVILQSRSETQRASDADRRQAARQVAAVLARAYGERGSWSGARFDQATALAAREDAVLIVRDGQGQLVLGPSAGQGQGRGLGAGRHAAAVSAAVTDGGRRVGTAELRFPGTLARSEQKLRSALWRALLLGSAIAIAIALLVAALVTQRIAGPLRRLTSAARRLRSGDLSARAEQADMPGELGELAHAFDAMADALERESGARTRIVADLSHEVRTPMTILRGNLEELIDGIEPPTTERLASLHEEVLRLDGLIEQLDVLGRAGSPVRALDCAPVDLAELTAAALEALASQFAAKRLTAHADLAPVTVNGDRVKLGQVVANLLSNALKFTPEGGTIDVTIATGAAPDVALLAVADDGPGVSLDERERVFDRFWRGSTAKGVAGRGIGLAVVQEIVHAHGGTVTVDRGPRGGTRFTVVLPRQASLPP